MNNQNTRENFGRSSNMKSIVKTVTIGVLYVILAVITEEVKLVPKET